MRKIIFPLIIVILLGVLAVPVMAQGPSSYESTLNVTNVSGSSGTITLTYYNSDGTVAATYEDDIDPYETKFYTTLPSVSDGFNGSMIVSSGVPIAAASMVIGKDAGDSPMNYAHYVGVSNGSGTAYLPLLMDSNYGFNTFYYVQNTSNDLVDVAISYSDGLVVSAIEDLEPGASVKIDNQAEAHTAKKFTGTLTATGGDIAVTVVEWADGSYGKPLYSYSGFDGGSTNPVLPMVNQNNYGYWTAIPVQNLGTITTTVTLSYTPTKAGTACTETLEIGPGALGEFGSYAHKFSPQTPGTTCTLGQTFVGVATVTGNTASQPLVGIVNQLNTELTEDYDKGAALMGINVSKATPKVVFPEVYQWYGTWHWWSSITITNLSGSALPIGDVSCRGVGTSDGGAEDVSWSNTSAIANGEGWITDLYQDFGPMPNTFLGGVICTSATGEIVGTLNTLGHTAPDAIDTYTIYEGVNVEVTP